MSSREHAFAGWCRAAVRPLTGSAAVLAGLLLLPPAASAELQVASGERDRGAPAVWTDTNQGRLFYDRRNQRLYYQVRDTGAVDVTITVIRTSNGATLETWRRTVRDDETHSIAWDGTIGGKLMGEKRYAFRVSARDSGGATTYSARSSDMERDSFQLWQNRFPVRARHQYGDGMGAGRGHQGQDVFADCGTPLEAARGGRVQARQYQSAAGYYLVIDGRKTRRDYVYMHLRRAAPVAEGERVKTGQTIGKVGDSGNATGCHLHFELWKGPGWYEGGDPIDPRPHLKHWDSYS
jgi:murein DD-endopeptidase MepM/ murein hydrolase activator NlpD